MRLKNIFWALIALPLFVAACSNDEENNTKPNNNPTDKEEQKDIFVANYAHAWYYQDMFAPGTADSYFMFLSDKGCDSEGYELPGGRYYSFDLYTQISTDRTITPGTYQVDPTSPCAAGYINTQYSYYFKVNDEGNKSGAYDYIHDFDDPIIDGFVTINEDGSIYAELKTESDGKWHKIKYEGSTIAMYNQF